MENRDYFIKHVSPGMCCGIQLSTIVLAIFDPEIWFCILIITLNISNIAWLESRT